MPEMRKNRKIFSGILRFVIVFMITMAISTGIRMIASVVSGEQGAPSFVTPAFSLFGACAQILLLVAYLLLGNQIPIKNKVMKGLTFSALFWASAYMPQILGMMGGTSALLNENAMSMQTILLDTIGYLLGGTVMGFFLTLREAEPTRPCKNKNYAAACVTSAILFPAVLLVLEMLAGAIDKRLLVNHSFAIQENEFFSFYLVFYLFQAVSGFLFPVFYRLTAYNGKRRSWLRFASIYGWMLWTPIVLIVMFFGIDALPTVVFAGIMLLAMYLDSFVFVKVMERVGLPVKNEQEVANKV